MYQSEVLEWYRNQYNIPIEKFHSLKITEDTAYIDYYRRQFWNELRFGIREWGDDSLEFKMPPFMMLRQYGGVLPPPNGFNFDNQYTVKVEHYNKSSQKEENSHDGMTSTEKRYDYKSNPSDPWSEKSHVQESSYSMPEQDFSKLLELSESDEFWETLDELDLESTRNQ